MRRSLFLAIGVLALLVVLGSSGQVQAQRGRGASMPGFRPMVNPGFRGAFMPNFRSTPSFGFTPGFRGQMGTPGFRGQMFDLRSRGQMFDLRFRGQMGTPGSRGQMVTPRAPAARCSICAPRRASVGCLPDRCRSPRPDLLPGGKSGLRIERRSPAAAAPLTPHARPQLQRRNRRRGGRFLASLVRQMPRHRLLAAGWPASRPQRLAERRLRLFPLDARLRFTKDNGDRHAIHWFRSRPGDDATPAGRRTFRGGRPADSAHDVTG